MFGVTFKQIDLQKLPYQKIIILILTIICIVSVRSCSLKEMEVTSSGVKIKMYEAQVHVFESTVNKLGEKITTQLAVITNKDKAVQDLLSKNSTLQNLSSQVIVSSATTISDVFAPFTNVVDTIHRNDTVYLSSGSGFVKNDKWYSMYGVVIEDGIYFDSISFKDSTTYNMGTKRKPGLGGYFKPYDPTLEVISSNPYLTVKSLQNMKFVSKPKWYENRGVWFLAGVVSAGVGIYYIAK